MRPTHPLDGAGLRLVEQGIASLENLAAEAHETRQPAAAVCLARVAMLLRDHLAVRAGPAATRARRSEAAMAGAP